LQGKPLCDSKKQFLKLYQSRNHCVFDMLIQREI
jgi:hypothetical protein